VIEPEVPPGCEDLEKVCIGEDVSERLDVTPAKFRVIVTRRPKYAYRDRDGVFQAAAPAHLIEGGIPSEALLAHIAVAKYADGLPLYRQEAIYARDGVEIDRSLMAQWMGRVGFELEPLADAILAGNLVGRVVTWKKEGLGPWTNLGVGMVGALIGGFVFNVFHINLGLGEIKVTFEDLRDGSGKTKNGYKKL